MEELPTQSSASRLDPISQFVFGFELADFDLGQLYEIKRFFKNGFLNVDEVAEVVLKEVLANFITFVLENKLKISFKDFKDFCVAFVVPMSFCRTELLFFTEIFIDILGFKALLFHLEPVLACFGNGFSGACVVDVGGESTKVCCVQYGSVVLTSRIVLPFGGNDITQLCHDMTLSTDVNEFYCPLSALTPLTPRSLFTSFEKLKSDTCLFSKDKRVIKNFVGDIRCASQQTFKVKITLSNVCVLAPLGLFFPSMFASFYAPCRYQVHQTDLCRFEYEKSLLETRNELLNFSKNEDTLKTKIKRVSLDEAVVESISSLLNLDDKMSMATSILLVGGSTKINGMGDYIEKKVGSTMKKRNPSVSNVEILPRREEGESGLSSEYCSWLGMAIICGNEGCRDMWITPTEWRKERNIFLLRKKCQKKERNPKRKNSGMTKKRTRPWKRR